MSLQRWLGAAWVVVSLLSACADNPPAPIEDRTRPAARAGDAGASPVPAYRSQPVPGQPYTVQRGDTLYAIAFGLGVDHKALAARNGIGAPYTIFPGQVLATDLKSAAKPADTKKKPVQPAAPVPAPAVKVTPAPSTAPPVASKKTSPVVTKPSPPVVKTEPTKTLGPVTAWQWPTQGKVVRAYSANLHKGVDIAGSKGTAIRAAAPGVVVYAGTGVTGYGALLIVKHNEQYLSAYGHNDALLVREGAKVDAGQQIARMGSSGTDSVKLHFEIRRQGKPVDPMSLLPQR